jgi:hypothetical protein
LTIANQKWPFGEGNIEKLSKERRELYYKRRNLKCQVRSGQKEYTCRRSKKIPNYLARHSKSIKTVS